MPPVVPRCPASATCLYSPLYGFLIHKMQPGMRLPPHTAALEMNGSNIGKADAQLGTWSVSDRVEGLLRSATTR